MPRKGSGIAATFSSTAASSSAFFFALLAMESLLARPRAANGAHTGSFF